MVLPKCYTLVKSKVWVYIQILFSNKCFKQWISLAREFYGLDLECPKFSCSEVRLLHSNWIMGVLYPSVDKSVYEFICYGAVPCWRWGTGGHKLEGVFLSIAPLFCSLLPGCCGISSFSFVFLFLRGGGFLGIELRTLQLTGRCLCYHATFLIMSSFLHHSFPWSQLTMDAISPVHEPH